MIGLKKVLAALSLAAFVVSMAPMPADAAASVTRIKDIAKVQGVRSNQLVGYGLVVGFIANLEDLPVVPDSVAKVVMNERTGTIVMGGNVSVDECAITQGGLSIHVTKNTDVSQPDPLTYGSTIVANNTNVKVKDKPSSTIVLPATANVSDIVGALNAGGATPRDTISILQAMKASGALHAELELI